MLEIVSRISVGADRLRLTERLVSEVMPNGLTAIVVFDDSDYADFSNPTYSSSWAWQMNIEAGRVESRSPAHILAMMESGEYSHMFWFSKRASLSTEEKFMWILAHELQHFRQNLAHPELQSTGKLVRRVISSQIAEPAFQTIVPSELDAESAAYGFLISQLGVAGYSTYVNAEAERNYKARAYHEQLQMLLSSYCGDWAEQTRRLLCENRDMFSDEDLKTVGGKVSLEKLCSEVPGA